MKVAYCNRDEDGVMTVVRMMKVMMPKMTMMMLIVIMVATKIRLCNVRDLSNR